MSYCINPTVSMTLLVPEKVFRAVNERMVCPNMKKTTLENLAASLREMKTRVTVPEEVSVRARRAIEAMLAIG